MTDNPILEFDSPPLHSDKHHESPQETKGGEQRSFRKEERTPRKQANPRKLRVKENDTQNLKPVPVQTTSSQVKEESLEELQSGEQITNTVYSPQDWKYKRTTGY